MMKLVQYKYKKVMEAYANLDSMNRAQCIKLMAEVDWLLENGKKYANNQVAFEKKMNSILNAIDAKLAQEQDLGVSC